MKLNDKTKFLIVGLGLIGGSYAEALHCMLHLAPSSRLRAGII